MKNGMKFAIGLAIVFALSGAAYGAYILKPQIYGRRAIMLGIIRRYDLVNVTGNSKEQLISELSQFTDEQLIAGYSDLNEISS